HFAAALRLWRGPVAAGLPERVRAHPHFAAVDREIARTARVAADAALLCGRADQVLASVRRAAALYPLDEPLLARLVLSLAACGLQAEALATYEDARRDLAARLGVAAGTELAAAHARVLRRQIRPARHRLPTAPPDRARPFVRPAQLPPDLAVFAGRRRELAALDALWRGAAVAGAETRDGGEPVPDAVNLLISGPPGVGKTALAVHWAHRVADRFPDGRLHLELGGSAPHRGGPDPAGALRRLLADLGVPARSVRASVADLAAQYRSALAGRRLLVLLDDAACLQQLRPLLPAVPGCLTLVTSRGGPAEAAGPAERRRAVEPAGWIETAEPAGPPHLATAGVRALRLGLPSEADARELLVRRIGAARSAAEPEAVTEIIRRCGRLPSALALVAARAACRRDFPLAALAADLAEDAQPRASERQDAEPRHAEA
ncbi:BTAD domain-containing putative transcriptional regulator, partial [Streptomyces sp. NPDC004658]|uniref:BTAD domain-containing putative transcriptional regulator n=1 Tax=Streptomyces sp. NPDC004658 TaxID=3154672 RepID=UPI0033BC28AA